MNERKKKKPLIAVVGPTASGKTSLAIELAKKFNGEIISADSMQVYKEMNIGTAKPSMEERQGIAHYMMDVVSVCQEYTVGQYQKQATQCIDDVYNAGKQPILCGGTGFYIRSILHPMQFSNAEGNPKIRQNLQEFVNQYGNKALHLKLEKVDPESAQRLHENDVKRVIRALEIFELTGQPYSSYNRDFQSLEKDDRYQTLILGLQWPRDVLVERIQKRIDMMVDNGLIEEAKMIYNLHLPANIPSLQGIGYRQLFPYFEGTGSKEKALEDIFIQSRQYAKRQMTWFRNQEKVCWIDAYSADPYPEAQVLVEKFLSEHGE